MIARFAIDPTAFDMPGNDDAKCKATDMRLFEKWRLHGVLQWGPKFDNIQAAIGRLPIQRRVRWASVFGSTQYRKVEISGQDFASSIEDEKKLSALSPHLDVIGLEETRAAVYGVSHENISSRHSCGIELSALEYLDQSDAFVKAASAWKSNISTGENLDDIWNSRFDGMITFSSTISIVDRYCLPNSIRAFDKQEYCGLTCLLKRIGQTKGPRKKAVTIYTGLDGISEKQAVDSMEKANKSFKMESIASIVLMGVADGDFGRISHDRFIRCGPVVTTIGRGVELFRNKVSSEAYACAMVCDDAEVFQNTIEKELRRLAKFRKVIR